MAHPPLEPIRTRAGLAARRTGSWIADLTLFYFTLKVGGFAGAFIALMIVNDPNVSDFEMQEVAVAGWNLGLIYWALGFGFVHYVLVQGLYGWTFGKWLFGLRLVELEAETAKAPGFKRAMLRVVVFPVSLFPLGYGFFHGLFDQFAQGWHDMVAGTSVIARDRLRRARVEKLPPPSKSSNQIAA
jgi:uncharacterized RDD family membrane protein YckC